MNRHGSVTRLAPGKVDEYRRLHAATWPDILEKIKGHHFDNYSIFLRKLADGDFYLFSYFEYTGVDFAADCAAMAADRRTQEWWDLCKPCLRPLPDCAEGELWAEMEEVFHSD